MPQVSTGVTQVAADCDAGAGVRATPCWIPSLPHTPSLQVWPWAVSWDYSLWDFVSSVSVQGQPRGHSFYLKPLGSDMCEFRVFQGLERSKSTQKGNEESNLTHSSLVDGIRNQPHSLFYSKICVSSTTWDTKTMDSVHHFRSGFPAKSSQVNFSSKSYEKSV